MDNSKYTKAEAKYKRFDIISKRIIYSMLVLSILLIVLVSYFTLTKSDECMVLFGSLLVLDTVAILVIAPCIAKKRTDYLQSIQEERSAIIRTGLFKDVYDAYRHDEFEFNLTYDKLLFEEYHNNTINIGLQKNKHEFLIDIDEEVISIIIDEETDHPIETQILLSDISTMEQLFLTVNAIIEEQS